MMRTKEWWLKDWQWDRESWLYGETYGKPHKDIGGDEAFEKYWEEGKQAFLACLDPNKEDNPYSDYTNYRQAWRGPWYGGFRTTATEYFNRKYGIPDLQIKIRTMITSHGLKIEYDDEYNTPYAVTPEGYRIVIAEDKEASDE